MKKPLDDLIEELRCKGHNIRECEAFKSSGIMPEEEGSCIPTVTAETINHIKPIRDYNDDLYDQEWWEEGYRRMFSDAGCTHPDDLRRQQTVIANYYGPNHPYNETDKLKGNDQTPYRGELYGMLNSMEQAEVQTWITLDNESVVDQGDLLARGHYQLDTKINCYDLWTRVRNINSLRGPNYFKVTWIKGHLDNDANKAYITANIITPKEIEWHIETDDMATVAKRPYYLSGHGEDKIFLRMEIAMLAQTSYVKIWEKDRDTLEQETRNALEEQLFDDLFIQGLRGVIAHTQCAIRSSKTSTVGSISRSFSRRLVESLELAVSR